MKIGFNMLLWTGHVTEEDFPTFDTIKKVGFDGVEIPLFGGDVPHFEKVGKAVKNAGLGCTSVTVIPDEEHNPISPDAAHRQGGVDHLNWAIDCSVALGSEVLCGPFYQPLGVFTGAGPTEDEKQWAADVHKKVADNAAAGNVALGIEFLNRFECYFLNTMADAANYVKRVDHPNVGVLYDTFHANIEEKDPVGCITEHSDVINHIHISENDRGTPGKGHIDWAGTFKAIRACGYDNWLVIEAFGRAIPDLAAATRVWRDFFPSRESVYTEGIKFIKDQWAAAG
ncbi:MAG: sugar phosphate isomerase/epimerase [Sedimentisphaerales bacterium]|nr:sugar phosphate isomerase/epimerase [Sedimentisphaerales bacterium]